MQGLHNNLISQSIRDIEDAHNQTIKNKKKRKEKTRYKARNN
jgi:hypothetical protein